MSELAIVHADETLLVLNKPAGLLTVPGRGEDKQDCLSRRVQQHYPDALVVHRLDMATSGLVIMARGTQVQRTLSLAFAARNVYKQYEAVVTGLLYPPNEGWQQIGLPIFLDWDNRPKRTIDSIRGKPSLTHWRVLNWCPTENTSRLILVPVTGRSHQLRVHMQAIGHAILGDALYADPKTEEQAPRLMLHACSLELVHPKNNQEIGFFSPSPF